MVRFESRVLQTNKQGQHAPVVITALSTIKYLYVSGAKIILVGNWSVTNNSKILTVESAAGIFCISLPLHMYLFFVMINQGLLFQTACFFTKLSVIGQT